MSSWSVEDAEARFCAILDACLEDEPQIVTRLGIAVAALVPFAEWQRLQEDAQLSLKDLLLAPEPRFENVIPARRRF